MEKEVQNILSSLLISFRSEMSIKKLRYDFKEVTGYDVPFRKFGYSTIKDYLNSMPNTLRISGHGDYAIVLPVINEQNKHINDMVLRGYVPKTNSRRRPVRKSRRVCDLNNFSGPKPPPLLSIPMHNFRPPPLLSIPMHNFRPPTKNPNSSFKMSPLPNEYYLDRKSDNYFEQPASESCEKPALKSCEKPASKSCEKPASKSCEKPASKPCEKAASDASINYKARVDDGEQEDLDTCVGKFCKLAVQDDFCRKLQFPISEKLPQHESKVDPNVQQKLQMLISEHEDGIWCSELLTTYFMRFKEKLNPRDYGFCSVLELCDDLPRIFKSVRPSRRDWKFYNVNLANVHAIPYIAEYLQVLVPTSWYSRDIVRPDEIIDRQWLSNDQGINDYIQILISEVYDPSKFWVQLRSPKTTEALETLMDEMQEYYMVNAGKYQINEFSVRIGLFCVALFMNEYHRAVVTKVYDEHTMQVFYIDYGTVAEVSIRKTCFLHRKFSYLPQQAIQARLYNIMPVVQNTIWPREASCYMLNLVTERRLIALIANIDESKKILELIVSDTNSPDIDIHINDELITAGYAEIKNDAKTVEELTAPPHDSGTTNKTESIYIRMYKKYNLK